MSRVLRLWLRAAPGAPTEERRELLLETGRGVAGDHTHGRMRHVTIVFDGDWRAALRDLGRDVDPSARRANALVSGGDGRALVGRTIALGAARIAVKGVVEPCPVMDAAAQGLREALMPGGRGGIWGRVLEGGLVRPGDALADLGPTPPPPAPE